MFFTFTNGQDNGERVRRMHEEEAARQPQDPDNPQRRILYSVDGHTVIDDPTLYSVVEVSKEPPCQADIDLTMAWVGNGWLPLGQHPNWR